MTSSPSSRNALGGVVNCVLVLLWTGATIYLIGAHAIRGAHVRFFLVLIAGAPLLCFYAYRVTTTRLLTSMLIAAALGFLKEYLAAAADVWRYPPLDTAEGLPGVEVALIMGFAAIAAFALAEAVDALLLLRRRLQGTNLYINSGIVFVVFATFVVLLSVEDGGASGRAAISSPGVIIFYMFMGLLAWYFASMARTGRLISLLLGGGLICLAGDHLGAEAGLWRFHSGTDCPLFLILASWPLEVFVWYCLGAAVSELFVSPADRREHLDVMIRGSIDRPALWTAQRQSYLMTAIVATAIGAMVYERAAHWDYQFLFAVVIALVYTAAILVAEHAYWLRVVWLAGLGAAFGFALDFCELLTFESGTGTGFFMLPIWAMVAVATYGIGALLARNEWSGEEWTSLDTPGLLPVAITIGIMALVVGAGLYFGLIPDTDIVSLGIAILFWVALAVVVAARLGMAPAIPIILIGLGFLYGADEMGRSRHVLAILLFVAVTAHLVYKTTVELRTRTLLCLTVSAIFFSLLMLGGATTTGVIAADADNGAAVAVEDEDIITAEDVPWFLAVGMAPLLLLACSTVSGSGSGSKQNRTPRNRPTRLHDKPWTPAGPERRPAGETSIVALALAREDDGDSRAERVTACLHRALRLLNDHSPGERTDRPISRFVPDGSSVFIKPNLVLPLYSPCIVLPDLVDELARTCAGLSRDTDDDEPDEEQEETRQPGAAKVRIGETSLSEFTSRQTLESTGFKEFWEDEVPDGRIEVELLDESYWRPIQTRPKCPAGGENVEVAREQDDPEPFNWLPKSLCECNIYINVSKLKTHYITGVTLSVKNSLGLVPDDDKWIEHCGCYGNVHRLARKLARIMCAKPPNLAIIDGFDGLEGDGPFVGTRVDTEFVIASADPVAADCVGAALMGRDVEDIATCAEASKLGLGTSDWGQIEVVVEDPSEAPGCDTVIRDLPEGLAEYSHEFEDPKKAPTQEVAEIGPIRLISQDDLDERAGPWSTLYGVLSLIRPLAEVYRIREWEKLRGLTIVYGGLKDPIEAEFALLFGDRAIESQHLVYAPVVWRVPGEIPNRYLAAMDRIAWGGDVTTVKLIATALRKTKGDYL